MTNRSWDDERHLPTLSELNDEHVELFLIPVIIFVCILMLIGVPGNALVLYIYSRKLPRSNHRVFILWLAVLDMLGCCITFPFYITFKRYPFMFYNSTACKILKLTSYYMSSGSGLLLFVIAIERYLKVCRPWGRQMSERGSLISCSIVLIIAMAMSWPAGVLFGHSTIRADDRWNVTGIQCGIQDHYLTTKLPMLFNAVLILIVVSVSIFLIVIYIFIARQIYKRRRRTSTVCIKLTGIQSRSAGSSDVLSTTGAGTSTSGDAIAESACAQETAVTDTQCSSDDNLNSTSGHNNSVQSARMKKSSNQVKAKKRLSKRSTGSSKDKQEARVRRTTIMLLLITVIFILSFIPHLALSITAAINKTFVKNLGVVSKMMFHVGMRSAFINNVTNPIIYGFCDTNFRAEFKRLYRRICRRDE